MNRSSSIGAALGIFVLAAVITACGGGGGGGSNALPSAPSNNGGNAGGSTPAPPPLNATPTPVPPGQTAGPQLDGTMDLASGTYPSFTETAEAQGSLVMFTCGCTSQAGEDQLQPNGTFSIPQTADAIPASPSPTYTSVPGRNYLIVATQNGGSTTEGNGPESWQLEFLGNTPSHNLGLGTGSAPTTGDVFTAAGALFVYYNSQNNSNGTEFDAWNFNSILAWVNHLRSTSGANTAEQQLLNDIAAAQQAGKSLYPVAPPWFPSLTPNATIQNDLNAVNSSGDTALPTPCPGGPSGCTGTPNP